MYDYDLFVIGAGSGGVRAGRVAAGLGAKVAVAESRYLGGTCVNVGCIPKKLFAYGAHFREDLALAESYGWQLSGIDFDWRRLRENKDKEIARLNGVYDKLLREAGADILHGHANICDPHTVAVGEQTFSTKYILIATGAWPWIPDVPGAELAITSNEAFYFDTLPTCIAIVGGGYIAVEFASIFNGLGVETHLIYRGPLFLRGFDRGIREHLADEFRKKNIALHFDADVKRIAKHASGGLELTLNTGSVFKTNEVMYATGRRPLTANLGLENTAVKTGEAGAIKVDHHYRTDEPSIFAIGDVAGSMELTPIALAEGMAVANSLFGEPRDVDYRNIPTAIFSHPNIATVGFMEETACEAFAGLRIYETDFRHLKQTLGDNQERTYMKLVVDDESDKVVGAHMVGPDAGEIIQGLAVAMHAGATKTIFDRTIGIHPTAAEEFVTMRRVSRRYPS